MNQINKKRMLRAFMGIGIINIVALAIFILLSTLIKYNSNLIYPWYWLMVYLIGSAHISTICAGISKEMHENGKLAKVSFKINALCVAIVATGLLGVILKLELT